VALETRRGYRPHHGKGPNPRIKNPHPGMAALLLSDQSADPAIKAAKEIARIAQATAPRSSGPGPHMADQYEVNEVLVTAPTVPAKNPRKGAEVTNSAPGAVQTEFGGKRNVKHRQLLKAGAAVGEARGVVG